MNETKTITFKPTIFSKEHKLVFDPEFIELYRSTDDDNPVRFSKLEIDAFRFGVKFLRGYKTVFGRINQIDIQSSTGVIIQIRLISVYRIRIKQLHKKYADIINHILKYYISEIVDQYIKLFNYKQSFSIANVHFDQKGIQLDDKHNLVWSDIDLKSFTRYIGISSKSNTNIFKGFDYWEEWNSLVLYNVLRIILEGKNLLQN